MFLSEQRQGDSIQREGNFMKVTEQIELDLKAKGVEDIQEINQINGSLYFIQTKDSIYTYDLDEKTLEAGNTTENETDSATCMLTHEEQEKIANENYKLIHYVLKSFQNTGISYDELESVGDLGFSKALASFDKMKGIRFSTYAINCIKNEVLFFLRKEKKHLNVVSFNKELLSDGKGNTFTLEDTLEDTKFSEYGIDHDLLEEEQKSALLRAIKQLNSDEQYIMSYRYGICGLKAKTQKELATEMKMSQANVSKIQRNCLKKLKFIMQKEVNRF